MAPVPIGCNTHRIVFAKWQVHEKLMGRHLVERSESSKHRARMVQGDNSNFFHNKPPSLDVAGTFVQLAHGAGVILSRLP